MLELMLSPNQLRIWTNEYAKVVADKYEPDAIILFGSVARREPTQHSDIDIIVIGGDLPENHRARFRCLVRLRPPLAPIQVHTYTRSEWERTMATRHVTALEALSDGSALYGETLFNRWRRQFAKWQQQGLYRTDCTWVLPTATH